MYLKTKTMKCNKMGCPLDATWELTIELRALKSQTKPATTSPIMHLCDEHAMEAKWDDIVTDEWFSSLGNKFLESGFIAPVKEFSNLVLNPIGNENNNSSIP